MVDVNRSLLYQLFQFVRLSREVIAIPLKNGDMVEFCVGIVVCPTVGTVVVAAEKFAEVQGEHTHELVVRSPLRVSRVSFVHLRWSRCLQEEHTHGFGEFSVFYRHFGHSPLPSGEY